MFDGYKASGASVLHHLLLTARARDSWEQNHVNAQYLALKQPKKVSINKMFKGQIQPLANMKETAFVVEFDR